MHARNFKSNLVVAYVVVQVKYLLKQLEYLWIVCGTHCCRVLQCSVFPPKQPHAVVPSPGHGTTIHCDVGSTCSVPVYMTGDPG